MKKLKVFIKKLSAILLLIFAMLLTGCGDINDIEKLGFSVALGVDLGNYNEVIASVQIIKTGGSTENKVVTSDIYSCSGNTIYDALSNLSQKLGKPIKFSNEKCIIIGEKMAETNITPIIDLSLRYSDMRTGTPILITQGKASDVLNTKITENPISAFTIDTLVELQKRFGFAATSTNLDFINNESNVTTYGVINVEKKADKNMSSNLVLSGSAVFKNGKLIGYMNSKETRGMQWIKSSISSGNIVIGTKAENKISLSIISSGSSFKSSIQNKSVNIGVNIKERSNIREVHENVNENLDFNANPNILDSLSQKQDKIIYNEANLAVKAAQNKFNADIFDFSGLLYRKHPHEWNNIKGSWDKIFPHANINISVSSQIKQTGNISKPILNQER